jgi:hypothetical protein
MAITGVGAGFKVGDVSIATTSNKGLSVEYWANRCLDKIITVGENSHPLVAQQAEAFKKEIRVVLVAFMKNAIKSDRTTLYNEFIKQGETQMAEILRRI